MTKFGKLIDGIRQKGFRYVLVNISSRLPRAIFFYVHAILLQYDNPEVIPSPADGYLIRFADQSDADKVKHVGVEQETLLRRIKRGDKCTVAEKDGKIVSIAWAIADKMYVWSQGVHFDTGPEGHYIYGEYTHRDHRRKGLMTAQMKLLFDYYMPERYKSFVSIDNFNQNSIRFHERMGYRTVGECHFCTILGIKFCRKKSWPYKVSKFRMGFRTGLPGYTKIVPDQF